MTQNSPYLAVVAAVILRGDKVLVGRRTLDREIGGCWEFPGGKIEAGETPEEALRREIREELSLDVEVGLFLAYGYSPSKRGPVRLEGYLCSIAGGELSLRDHDAVRWLGAHELAALEMPEADRPIQAACLKTIFHLS